MKKLQLIVLIISILLLVISAILLFNGIWKDNYTAKMIGYIMLIIVNILSFINACLRLNKNK